MQAFVASETVVHRGQEEGRGREGKKKGWTFAVQFHETACATCTHEERMNSFVARAKESRGIPPFYRG